jgi:hypothetical protein
MVSTIEYPQGGHFFFKGQHNSLLKGLFVRLSLEIPIISLARFRYVLSAKLQGYRNPELAAFAWVLS